MKTMNKRPSRIRTIHQALLVALFTGAVATAGELSAQEDAICNDSRIIACSSEGICYLSDHEAYPVAVDLNTEQLQGHDGWWPFPYTEGALIILGYGAHFLVPKDSIKVHNYISHASGFADEVKGQIEGGGNPKLKDSVRMSIPTVIAISDRMFGFGEDLGESWEIMLIKNMFHLSNVFAESLALESGTYNKNISHNELPLSAQEAIAANNDSKIVIIEGEEYYVNTEFVPKELKTYILALWTNLFDYLSQIKYSAEAFSASSPREGIAIVTGDTVMFLLDKHYLFDGFYPSSFSPEYMWYIVKWGRTLRPTLSRHLKAKTKGPLPEIWLLAMTEAGGKTVAMACFYHGMAWNPEFEDSFFMTTAASLAVYHWSPVVAEYFVKSLMMAYSFVMAKVKLRLP